MKPVCFQVNWARQFGGGEVYTRFFSKALLALGWEVHLIIDHRAGFWNDIGLDGVHFIPIRSSRDIPAVLPGQSVVVITHTTLPPDIARQVAQSHYLAGVMHTPLADRNPAGLAYYHRILAVSSYVAATVRALGLRQVQDEALLGVADQPLPGVADVVSRRSEYAWDRRKYRDRLFSWIEPLLVRRQDVFARRPGLTLGIVSRLTPIKQFPSLFKILAPIFAAHSNVNLEVFGAGGYASVRDLRLALAPLGGRARFWGQQRNVGAIYRQLDYLMTGLPEKEALGLNVIEAQACDTPVLAVDAPPFNETVIDGKTGYLYCDPRKDNGAAFSALLDRIASASTRLHPVQAVEHLSRFTFESFVARLAPIMTTMQQELRSRHV